MQNEKSKGFREKQNRIKLGTKFRLLTVFYETLYKMYRVSTEYYYS